MYRTPNPGRLLFTVDEAAEVLAIGRTRLYELMARGTIPFVMIGTSRRISADSLAAYVDGLTAGHA